MRQLGHVFTAGLLAAIVFQMALGAQAPRPLWIIAHHTNDEAGIARALRDGANAVEFDIMSDGHSFVVRHPRELDVPGPTLSAQLAAAVRERQRLHLMYVDYKGPDFSAAAGARLVAELRAAAIPASGIRALVSTTTLQNGSLFRDFPQEEWIAPQFDDNNPPDDVVKFFRGAGIGHGWYGGGLTKLLADNTSLVNANMRTAVARRGAGSPIKGVVFWTLDNQVPIRDYLRLGVDAILIDRPGDVAAILAETEFAGTRRLATKADSPW